MRLLVDSGATYSLLPTPLWEDIGLEPLREMTFTLADGTAAQRRIGECRLSLPHGAFHTPVILGEAGDEALLGAVTLEIFGLILHPFSRTLEPMRAMLANSTPNLLRRNSASRQSPASSTRTAFASSSAGADAAGERPYGADADARSRLSASSRSSISSSPMSGGQP